MREGIVIVDADARGTHVDGGRFEKFQRLRIGFPA